MDEFPDIAGFDVGEVEDRSRFGRQPVRPLSMAWITDELLARTRRVWSKAYRRPVDENEAIEILMNVRQMAVVLLKAKEEAKTE